MFTYKRSGVRSGRAEKKHPQMGCYFLRQSGSIPWNGCTSGSIFLRDVILSEVRRQPNAVESLT